MNIFAISGLINAISVALLGAFVYFKDRQSQLSQRYVLFSLVVACWSLCYFFWLCSSNKIYALVWLRLLMVADIYIPVFYLHFILVFLGVYKNQKKVLYVGYLIFTCFALFNFTNLFIKDAVPKLIFKYWPVPGVLFGAFFLVWLYYCVYSCYLMFKSLKVSYGLKRQQIKYMLVAIIIGYLGGSTNYFLFYDIHILPYGNFLIPLYIGLITYAIIQHRLFDINIVIKRTIVYSSLIALITVIYILVIFIAERVFSHIIGYSSFIMTIIAATIIALVFIPLKNRIQYVLDRTFFKGTLDSLAKQKELMQEELTRSERLKAVATLAAGMAHEIKNPLTAIKAFTEHLKERKDDPEFIAKFERIVGGEVDKINQLVRQLLDFSKSGLLNLKDVDLNSLLDEIITLLSSQVLRCKIIIVKSYSPDVGIIKADPNQLKQAFLNLMLNSIEAMPNGGGLSIATAKDSARGIVEVSIQDTGMGILSKNLPNVFDPFYSTKESGTGLGLSITYDIIKKHNGAIKIESQPNKGTLVRVII